MNARSVPSRPPARSVRPLLEGAPTAQDAVRPVRDLAQVPAAAWAAVAEAGLWFVPLSLIAHDSAQVVRGPLGSYGWFLLLFVAGTVAATTFRRHRLVAAAVPPGAAGIGLLQAFRWADGSGTAIAVCVALLLLAAFRIVSLAIRDWREPISLAFGLGTAVLVLETAIVSSGRDVGVLPAVTILWFVGSLASRAASVRLDTPREDRGSEADGAEGIRSSIVLLLVLAGLMGVFVLLGGRHGLFDLTGRGLLGVFAFIVGGMGYVMARVLAGPLAWVAVHLHLGNWLLVASERFRHVQPPRVPHGAQAGGSSRLFGLVLFGIIGLLLFRAVYRRMRSHEEAVEAELEPPVPAAFPLSARRRLARRLAGNRRELPEDAVRRWYAETLVLLEDRGLPKPPNRTPGEFLPQVVGAYPDAAPGFTALTRAYEDVRYGGRRLDERRLGTVEANVQLMLQGFRRSDATTS